MRCCSGKKTELPCPGLVASCFHRSPCPEPHASFSPKHNRSLCQRLQGTRPAIRGVPKRPRETVDQCSRSFIVPLLWRSPTALCRLSFRCCRCCRRQLGGGGGLLGRGLFGACACFRIVRRCVQSRMIGTRAWSLSVNAPCGTEQRNHYVNHGINTACRTTAVAQTDITTYVSFDLSDGWLWVRLC